MNASAQSVSESRVWIPILAAVGLLLLLMLYLLIVAPHRGIGAAQPIPFSHRVHAGVKQISCRFCHPGVDRSRHAGIPSVQKCLYCHDYIIREHPELVKEREYYESGRPVPWVRVYFIPDHVRFDHRPHIAGKIDCSTCHGRVERMDRLKRVDFKMGFCIACHKRKNAEMDCWMACHK